jgi:hypothetical protein
MPIAASNNAAGEYVQQEHVEILTRGGESDHLIHSANAGDG